MYSDTDREIAKACGELARFGIAGRNLRILRRPLTAEAQPLEQVMAPALRLQPRPPARGDREPRDARGQHQQPDPHAARARPAHADGRGVARRGAPRLAQAAARSVPGRHLARRLRPVPPAPLVAAHPARRERDLRAPKGRKWTQVLDARRAGRARLSLRQRRRGRALRVRAAPGRDTLRPDPARGPHRDPDAARAGRHPRDDDRGAAAARPLPPRRPDDAPGHGADPERGPQRPRAGDRGRARRTADRAGRAQVVGLGGPAAAPRGLRRAGRRDPLGAGRGARGRLGADRPRSGRAARGAAAP